MSRKVTIQQIADHVGVSKFSVSRALSGKSGVSHLTRDSIYKAATQLGYFVQKGIRTSHTIDPSLTIDQGDLRTGVVAVFFPDTRYQTEDSLYWGPIVKGISLELKRHGLEMVIITEFSNTHVFRIINPESLLGIIGVGMISTPLLLEINKLNIPCILIDYEDPLVPCDTLFMNNYDCTRQLTNYLIGLGHRTLQFVGDIRYARSFQDRWLGFRSVLEDNGIFYGQHEELLNLSESNYINHLKECLLKLIEGHNLPSALVCANDDTAVKVIHLLRELGIDVPRECSVTGFDNIEQAASFSPKLTTVNVAKETVGIRGVELLLRRINQQHDLVEKVLLSGDLIISDSTAPPLCNN